MEMIPTSINLKNLLSW